MHIIILERNNFIANLQAKLRWTQEITIRKENGW